MNVTTSQIPKHPARSSGGVSLVGEKFCGLCEQTLPLDSFYRSKSAPDGLQSRCKDCQKSYSRKWNEQNRERHLANKRRSWERNKERINAKRRAERDEYVLGRERKWRAANADKLKQQNREYRAANPERVKEWRSRWSEKHGSEWRRQHYLANRAWYLARNHIQRRRDGRAIDELADAIHELLEQPCAYCGTTEEEIEIDHIVPLSRGGTNDPENLAPACRPCNRSKWNRLPDEWQGRSAA